jgi:hypothetical protein
LWQRLPEQRDPSLGVLHPRFEARRQVVAALARLLGQPARQADRLLQSLERDPQRFSSRSDGPARTLAGL